MSQSGPSSSNGSSSSAVQTLTGNSGGAVSPDGAGNIDVLGNNSSGIDIAGTPASNLLTVVGLAASETQQGTVELATAAETTSGVSNSLGVHPRGLNVRLGPQTSNGLMYGQGGAGTNLNSLSEATNGQLPIGSTGNPPVLSTLTSGTNISITNGAGSITINAEGNVSGPGSSTDNALARWNGVSGSVLQDSTVLVTDVGEMTNASQPAFLAFLGSNDNNATGNGTVYTLGGTTALTEIFDQGSDFVTTGTFTAPVTGRYFFSLQIRASSATAATSGNCQIITSNRTYRSPPSSNSLSTLIRSLVVLADMDASDTATFSFVLNGMGADTADIVGGTPLDTFLCGNLTC